MKWNAVSDNPCNLCPRACRVLRKDGVTGFCGMKSQPVIARAALHMWEEPCISGNQGSGTVFFVGCNLKCVYCQNYEIAAGSKGKVVSEERLSEIFIELQEKGAANINLVTPDHFIIPITKALRQSRDRGLKLPVIFNGSGYQTREMIAGLEGIIDIFLTDFKYMEDELAEKYSSARDYPQIAAAALKEMMRITGEPAFNDRGMMTKGTIVRHLLLPGHKKNAKEVIRHVYDNYGDCVYLSLMNQYTPFERMKEKSEWEELCRKVTPREYRDVIDYAINLGVKNAFIQEGATAKESFIPSFDLEGINK